MWSRKAQAPGGECRPSPDAHSSGLLREKPGFGSGNLGQSRAESPNGLGVQELEGRAGNVRSPNGQADSDHWSPILTAGQAFHGPCSPSSHTPKSFSDSHRPSSPLIGHPKSNDLTRRGDTETPRGDGVEGGSCEPRRRREGSFPRASRWRGPRPCPHPDSGLGTLGIIRKSISRLQAVWFVVTCSSHPFDDAPQSVWCLLTHDSLPPPPEYKDARSGRVSIGLWLYFSACFSS